MNIAFFLKPKVSVAYLYSDFTLRQALEKMHHYGYTAIPVVNKDGSYAGTVSEGDFLWYMMECFKDNIEINFKSLEETHLNKIIRVGSYKAVKITADVDELLNVALNQNFVPVTDDLDSFIGIVTRRDIIKHLVDRQNQIDK
ncbi:MAG: CBS domain-containing protein [Clostridiales bacterium]|nr:CBS domain-containing protein [Clostridiales bacterium]MCD7828542.1 CBS domain-containing protein [Clostridiales bacterium]